MSKSAIYIVNNTPQNVADGGTINLGTIIRRFGQCLNLSGTGIQLLSPGYYDVDASITIEPATATEITVTMYKDGVAVPGATATDVSADANDPVNLSISSLVRKFCPCADGIESLSFQISGAAASVTNIAVVVEKI
jgi:hypothetical protein